MALADRLRNAVDALLGVSAYEGPPPGTELPAEQVTRVRKALGGNIQPLPTTRLRWYLNDLEAAQAEADTGNIRRAAQLCRTMNRDGTYRGLLTQRTKGLVRLPLRYYGDGDVTDTLKSRNGTRSVFQEMHPPSELQLLDGDGIKLGIGVGELVPVKGRKYPVLVRLQPEQLNFRWNEGRWYFQSLAGTEPITPGDGRWVLHIPGGRQHPWEGGEWYGLGRSFINKEHAIMYRANYCAKLANPARVAMATNGASEAQRYGFFKKVAAWGVNSVFELLPGWDIKLLESNGRGWEVFQRQIDSCDKEMMIQLAGQILTTVGGTGFDGQDSAQAIRQDLIVSDGEDLAYTLNTQTLPSFILGGWGEAALEKGTGIEWDTGTPADKEKETRILQQSATALEALNKSLEPYKKSIRIEEYAERFGMPTEEGVRRAEEVMAQQEGRKPVGRPEE